MKRWPGINFFNPLHFLAFGFGSGLAPKAPGTFGTLAAIPVVALLALTPLWFYLLFIVLGTVFGIYLCRRTADKIGVHDHPAIVWDEIIGYAIAMFALPFEWPYIIAAFLLFRLFDISKPGPIGWLDKRLTGGSGIMMDDVLAGVVSNVIILGVLQFI
ncbi:MAG: phosphatidylglycerophosphatase A family protein [Pseudomonadota bacterium]